MSRDARTHFSETRQRVHVSADPPKRLSWRVSGIQEGHEEKAMSKNFLVLAAMVGSPGWAVQSKAPVVSVASVPEPGVLGLLGCRRCA
jgi:hypothetical protein